MGPAIHPGEFVREDVAGPLGIAAPEAARLAGMDPGEMDELLACRLAVGADAAAGLAAPAENTASRRIGVPAAVALATAVAVASGSAAMWLSDRPGRPGSTPCALALDTALRTYARDVPGCPSVARSDPWSVHAFTPGAGRPSLCAAPAVLGDGRRETLYYREVFTRAGRAPYGNLWPLLAF